MSELHKALNFLQRYANGEKERAAELKTLKAQLASCDGEALLSLQDRLRTQGKVIDRLNERLRFEQTTRRRAESRLNDLATRLKGFKL